MKSEIVVPLTEDQFREIADAETAKQQIEERKSLAVRFLLLAHATKDRVDAALQAGKVQLRHLESGGHVLVIPGEPASADTEG